MLFLNRQNPSLRFICRAEEEFLIHTPGNLVYSIFKHEDRHWISFSPGTEPGNLAAKIVEPGRTIYQELIIARFEDEFIVELRELPRAPNIGLNNIYLSPGQKPCILSPANVYHFAVKDIEVQFIFGELLFSITKNDKGRHILFYNPASISVVRAGLRGKELLSGRNEIKGLIIVKSGDAFEVRPEAEKVGALQASLPIESPEAVRASIEPKDAVKEYPSDFQKTIYEPAAAKKAAAREIKESNYYRVQNAVELRPNDAFPGHQFDRELRDYEKWTRELPIINDSPESSSYELIRRAVDLAKRHTGDVQSRVEAVADLFDQNYSPFQNPHVPAGEMVSQGYFLSKGGCCRHRASLLTYILQQAGIKARYIRSELRVINEWGGLILDWHAWVEIDLKGDGKFDGDVYIVDPNMKVRGMRKIIKTEESKKVIYQVIEASGTPALRSIGEPREYHVDYAEFNAVWRKGVKEISREELLASFEKGMVVEKRYDQKSDSYAYILRKPTNGIFETMVTNAAYDLFQQWVSQRIDRIGAELGRQVEVMLPYFDEEGSMWFKVDISSGQVKALASSRAKDANVEVRVKLFSDRYLVDEVRISRKIYAFAKFMEVLRERLRQVSGAGGIKIDLLD